MYDSARNTANPRTCYFRANASNAEYCSNAESIDFNPNDFQIKSSWDGVNKNNDTYIYLAIKEN